MSNVAHGTFIYRVMTGEQCCLWDFYLTTVMMGEQCGPWDFKLPTVMTDVVIVLLVWYDLMIYLY